MWARQGLNLRPLPCEGSALPLSYAPGTATFFILGKGVKGLEADEGAKHVILEILAISTLLIAKIEEE